MFPQNAIEQQKKILIIFPQRRVEKMSETCTEFVTESFPFPFFLLSLSQYQGLWRKPFCMPFNVVMPTDLSDLMYHTQKNKKQTKQINS